MMKLYTNSKASRAVNVWKRSEEANMGGGKGSMFRFADGKDKLLMLLGTMGSIGDGLQYPLTMFVLSSVINDYGNPGSSPSNDTVDKVSISFPITLKMWWVFCDIVNIFKTLNFNYNITLNRENISFVPMRLQPSW